MAGNDTLTVGVLALQGDFREHLAVLRGFGADAVPVRRPEELDSIDGIVIPGGESTVIDKLSRIFGLAEPLKRALAEGLPAYGTCAGLIMLSARIVDGIAGQESLGALDIDVRRNAFGSQTESFEVDLEVPAIGEPPLHAVFIRAPVVERVGDGVKTLATLRDGRVVAVEQGNLLGTSFHPEMTDDHRFHRYFLDKVRAAR
ncbi:pyridoxal 5'-phosphate synthase glutaminase subunit PdxT [Cryobacterium sp. BB736]|uniref:pyridoxal 5'-phosphate synthase glutaminase subunit PdxT n=1 Tax=Cryobacterium sp. BB736 TaxID=2746963 RepID=UPI00351C5B98